MSWFITVYRANLSALTLSESPELTRVQNMILGAVHVLGFALLARALNLTFGEFLFFGIVLLFPFVVLRANLLSLAPWFFVYPLLALRFVLTRVSPLPSYLDDAGLNLIIPLVHLPSLAVASFVYSLCISIHNKWRDRGARFLLGVVAIASIAWASAEFIGHRTFGVTGTDPYAYVQMGVDLATRGTALHRFYLFPDVLNENLAWYPVVHVGYHLPLNTLGDAATVWPPAGSVPYALAFLIANEEGLYWVNPILSIFAALATGWMAWQLTSSFNKTFREIAAILSGALVLSSHQQSIWARVPMVDSEAELFTVLAFLFAFTKLPQLGIRIPFILSGLFLGLAYDVRHTQVLIAPALVSPVLLSGEARRDKIVSIGLLGLASVLVASPDLWYHHLAFGSLFHPESNEFALFSGAAFVPGAISLWEIFARGNEFGWLLPLMLIGGWQFARSNRPGFFALAIWITVLIVFHLFYSAVRLRDLIPIFPPLAFFVAFGFTWLALHAFKVVAPLQRLALVALIFLSLELFVLRVWYTIGRPLQERVGIFGYLTREERWAFEDIANSTPTNSIIGAGFNTGPLDMYSHRATVRPADWSEQDRAKFICAMQEEGRAVYLLDDSVSMDTLLANVKLEAEKVGKLDIPVFDESEVGQVSLTDAGSLWKLKVNCR